MHFIGVDVQETKPCPYAVLDEQARLVASDWLPHGSAAGAARGLRQVVESHRPASMGIDAPRMPLPSPRAWYWRGGSWRRRTSEKGHGRHCEVVIKAHSIANPQWTPLLSDAPAWMRVGFALFDALREHKQCHEVFPSASYKLLKGAKMDPVALTFAQFDRGPKDMLDAVVAAFTVREFLASRGTEAGGGDGLGTTSTSNRIAAISVGWPARLESA